jgi:hypothetical protein
MRAEPGIFPENPIVFFAALQARHERAWKSRRAVADRKDRFNEMTSVFSLRPNFGSWRFL